MAAAWFALATKSFPLQLWQHCHQMRLLLEPILVAVDAVIQRHLSADGGERISPLRWAHNQHVIIGTVDVDDRRHVASLVIPSEIDQLEFDGLTFSQPSQVVVERSDVDSAIIVNNSSIQLHRRLATTTKVIKDDVVEAAMPLSDRPPSASSIESAINRA